VIVRFYLYKCGARQQNISPRLISYRFYTSETYEGTNNLNLIIMRTILIGFTILSGLTSLTTPIVSFNNESIMTNYESIVALLFFGCGGLAMIGTITIQLTSKK
jgi:hypothetical protein